MKLGLGIILDAARDRAAREVSEGAVRYAVGVHDAVLLDAAMQLLDGTDYAVARREVET